MVVGGGTVGESCCVSNPSATPSILGTAERLAEGPPAASASSADREEKEGRERERASNSHDRLAHPILLEGELTHTHTHLSLCCIRRQQERRGKDSRVRTDSENYSGHKLTGERGTGPLRIVGLVGFGAPQELLRLSETDRTKVHLPRVLW